MNFVCAPAAEIPQALYDSLAAYRYEVFVQRLGWELPSQPGYEQDQFDHEETVHVVARRLDGSIVGCGRLLPTTGPYLLEEVFPGLLNGLPTPRSPQIWELSRFAAMPAKGAEASQAPDYMAERLLLQALRFCAKRGVTHLLAVSTPPVERLLQRAGVECQRLGPPEMVGGKPVIAFVIAVSEASIAALARIEAAALAEEAPVRAARGEGLHVLQELQALAYEQLRAVNAPADAPPQMSDNAPNTTLH